MTINFKKSLLASVAAGAISVLAASPAAAFDEMNWSWDLSVKEKVIKNINILPEAFLPTGMVLVQDLQVFIGSLESTSTVKDITNVQPTEAGVGGAGSTATFAFEIDDDPDPSILVPDSNTGELTVLSAFVDEGSDFVEGVISLEGVQLDASASLNAVKDLPEVISAATSVANNTSIESAVMVELDEGQFVFDVTGDEIDPVQNPNAGFSANADVAYAQNLGLNAILGNLSASRITATSTVKDIVNASVDSAATAVGNNLSIEVNAASAGDQIVMADAVQFAFADLTATSKVSNVTVSNYTNLGKIGALVNSAATAVGNNKSITVNAPVTTVVTQ